MRTLKAEVEKGSVRTAIGHGLVDPKELGNFRMGRQSGRSVGAAASKAVEHYPQTVGKVFGFCFIYKRPDPVRKGIRLIFLNQIISIAWIGSGRGCSVGVKLGRASNLKILHF